MLATVLVLGLALSSLAVAQDGASMFDGVDLSALSAAEKQFLQDEDNLNLLGLSPYTLGKSLRGKPAGEVATAVKSLVKTLDEAKYHEGPGSHGGSKEIMEPEGDFGSIPLNTQAGGFNGMTVQRPPELDKFKRDPGIFSVKHYVGQRGGVPTFYNARVALRTDDLVASKVDVVFVGAPGDNGSGWRDAVHAPDVMRAMFQGYATTGYDVYLGLDPSKVLTLADFGNLPVDKMSVERTVGFVRTAVKNIADTGAIPFVVGGDHSIMYSTVSAVAETHGKGNVAVVQLDAHFDGLRDLDHTITDEQTVSALLRDGWLDGKNLIQVGIRGQVPSPQDAAWLKSQGIRSYTMSEVETRGWDKVSKEVLSGAKKRAKKVFVSFDMSVLDPAYALGAGRPAPNGFTVREIAPLVRGLCMENDVVGFEVLDVAPFLDLSYQTAYTANYVMSSCLSGIAYRKTVARHE
jgi:agmatinase